MAEATLAPESASAVVKTAVIKIRNAATIKLSYMRTLATKLFASSRSGIASTVTFLRRSWGILPVALMGSGVVGGLTSTRKGYLMVTGFISSVIKSAFRLLGTVRRGITDVLDYGIQLLGKSVGKLNPKKGERISKLGYVFTDKRESFLQRTALLLSNTAIIVKNAYEHKLVTLIVPIWSSLVGLTMLIDVLAKGLIASLVTEIPAVGAAIASVLSGGWALVIGVLIVASISALIALALKSDDIVGTVVETSEEPVATSEIKDVQQGEVTINVTGDVTPELAQAIAEKHVEAELAAAEAAVKQMAKPQSRPNIPNKNKKKK